MGGHRARIAVSVAFVTLVTGLASGCSGAQGASGPDVGPPTSSTSSTVSDPPSASGSPSASTTLDAAARARIPKAARAHTAKGAEAFARFYLEQVNQAWMKPDPELIRPYALKSCKTCANILETAEWLHDNKFRYDGEPQDIGPSIVLPESTRSAIFVEVSSNQLSRRIVDGEGAVVESVDFAYSASRVELRWSEQTWRVREIKEAL